MTTTNPEKIGRYQVIDRVGRGGMGVLYRGIDPVLDREVAIKVMLNDFSEDEEQMRPRFYREARAAAKLQHRHIVTIFEFAEEGNTPYIVMEFLRGVSLAERVRMPPPLSVGDKLDIVAQLCAGLGYAHEQGVVHRDVKPANIFILGDGTVKLLDFGIAKMTSSTLTRQGDVLGSASYMSPEQVSGRETIDGRADIFSAGVVLYELLAGRKPFQGDAPTAIIVKILQEEPPPLSEIVPGLPPRVIAAVARALAKNPDDRFATALDFSRELQAIRKALDSGEEPEPMDATRFASTAMIRGMQEEIEKQRTPKPATAVATPPPASGVPKWAMAAGAGVVLAAVVGFLVMRGGAPSPASSSSAPAAAASTAPATKPAGVPAPATGAAADAAAPAAATSLQIASDPAGAAIALDGKDTRQLTPASIAIDGAGPHRLHVSKAGFQSADMRLSDADIRKGAVSVTLNKAEAAAVAVSITGGYPFSVVDGAKTISPPSESHELSVAPGKTLRLVAPEVLLNLPVRVESGSKHVEIQAPALGKLNVLTKFETCGVHINGRDLGYPPINNQTIAAGTYKIELTCPDGRTQVGSVVVAAGQVATARIQ